MRKIVITLVAVIVAVFSITTVAAQVAPTSSDPVASSDSNDVEEAAAPRYGVVRDGNRFGTKAPSEPVPIAPTGPVITASADVFEFVGVSSDRMRGNRGILNYTLACQADFPGSRMCSVDELLRTRNVPQMVGDFYAWIQPVESALLPSASNCNGWMSLSSHDTGYAIGFDSTCSAGLLEVTCENVLAVACCAPMPRG